MKPYKSKFSESQSQENYRDQIKSDREASNYHSTISRLALDLLDYCGGDESSIDREAENWIDSINDLEEADFAARHISTIKQTAEEFSEEGEMEEEINMEKSKAYTPLFSEAKKETTLTVIEDFESEQYFAEAWDELKKELKKIGIHSYYQEGPENEEDWTIIFSRDPLSKQELTKYFPETEKDEEDESDKLRKRVASREDKYEKPKSELSKIINKIKPKVLEKFKDNEVDFDYPEINWGEANSVYVEISLSDRYKIGTIKEKEVMKRLFIYVESIVKSLKNENLKVLEKDLGDGKRVRIIYSS